MKKYAIVTGTLSLLFGVNTQIARYDFNYMNVKRSITDVVTPNSNTFGSDKSLLIKLSPTDSLISPSRPNIPSVIQTNSPKKNPTSLPSPLKATPTAGVFKRNGSLKPTLRNGSSKLPSGSFDPTSINGSSKLPSGLFEPTSSNTNIPNPTPIPDSSEPTSSTTYYSSEPPSITESSEPPSITESSKPTSMTDSCKSAWKPGCINGKSVLQLVLKTDDNPNETKWDITNNFDTIVVEGEYNDKNNTHDKSYCLDTNQCYIFRIFDSLGDGICCESGVGFYKLYYDGYLVQEGGSFGSSDTSPPFGNCSPSMFPTKNPSLMPTTQLTGSPNNKPVSSSFLDFSEFLTLEGHTNWVRAVTFNPDGSKLASSSDDKTVKIWDTDRYKLFQTLEGHGKSVSSIAFSPYGSKLASASYDRTIRIWDMDDGGSHIHTIIGYYGGSISFNSVGSKLAFGSPDYAVVIWDITSNSTVSMFKGHTNMIMSVVFSPDGSKLASASLDNTIRTWDMNNDCHIQTLHGHDKSINSVAFSPNGKILASGSDDKTIRLWNIHTNKNSTLLGITDRVKEVAFSPDGKQLGAGLSDGTIILWDMHTFEVLQTLKGHDKYVISSIAFSPYNRRNRYQLASGSHDHTIIIWDSLCPAGTYINASESDCQPCSKGTYQNSATFSNSCELCPAGTYQSEEGGIKCSDCDLGSFQPLEGGASCERCRAGGYCPYNVAANTCGGGFIPCPVGTFNEKNGTSDVSSCIPCPHGTYSDKEGTTRCFQCPNRLDSEPKSSTCSFCAGGFYLKAKTVDTNQLIKRKDELCLPCPKNAICERNQTIETLIGNPGVWRDSLNTKEFYKCRYPKLCLLDNKCAEGHRSVNCEICVENDKHFEDGKCIDCPSYLQFGIIAAIATIIVMFVIFSDGTRAPSSFKYYLENITTILTRISFQAKLKIVISYIQVVTMFGPIYGLSMHSKFARFFHFLRIFSFGFVELFGMPASCIGDMKVQLMINAMWPYFVVIIIIGGKLLHIGLVRMEFLQKSETSTKFWRRSLQVIIVVFYFSLPSVSRSIFDARICKSFSTNDTDGQSRSFLLKDWRYSCNIGNAEYQGLLSIFWLLFAMWPIAVPLLFLGLLMSVRESVRSYLMTPIAEACQFLWSDYNKSFMWWDFLDVFRKITLMGLVIFIDTNEGSEKLFRLLFAIIVCIIYTTILALARPYRRTDDLYLAVISNLLLTCCFVAGIVIHECREEDDIGDDGENKVCEALFGSKMNSEKATLYAFSFTAAVLFIFMIMIFVLATNENNAPTIHLVSTNSSPRMDMPADCKFHVFFSHIWHTGQNKTHKIVAMLRLYLPTILIWLDVDDLKDISKLEDIVKDTVCFVLLYTKGYFKSENCCREVHAAMEKEKPIIVIYQEDGDNLDEIHAMKEECRLFCPELANLDPVKYIFENEPILWLNINKQFTIETVKLIVGRVLKNLPYYQTRPPLLDKGLKIGNELGPVGVLLPLQIITCSSNTGAEEIALKLIEESKGNNVSTCAVNPTSMHLGGDGIKKVMLLYLNQHMFSDPYNQICETVELIFKFGIQIVLVHETDISKGGCPIRDIISMTPDELREDPINLYKGNMAISIYPTKEYEKVSLRLIFDRMETIRSNRNSIVQNMSMKMLHFRTSMRSMRSMRPMRSMRSMRPMRSIRSFQPFRQ